MVLSVQPPHVFVRAIASSHLADCTVCPCSCCLRDVPGVTVAATSNARISRRVQNTQPEQTLRQSDSARTDGRIQHA
eukprot:2276011-Alexandrium_andersonii.AAC.1